MDKAVAVETMKDFFKKFEEEELWDLFEDPAHPTEDGALALMYDILTSVRQRPSEFMSPLGGEKVSKKQMLENDEYKQAVMSAFIRYAQTSGVRDGLFRAKSVLKRGSYK